MRHALFIAYHYPPEGSSSGVLRTLKHTRYLPQFGWRVTVLTLRRDAYEFKDSKLEEQIPEGTHVIRTRFLDVKRHLSVRGRYPSLLAIPDRWSGWWPWAVAAGRKVMREDRAEVIYSTSPHATAHLIALSLVRRSRVPWVADFRDPWYEEPAEPGTPWLGHIAARNLEHRVIRHADRIVASTVRLRDMLSARYPDKPKQEFIAIPNGYDEEDFSGIKGSSSSRSEFLIIHAGNLNVNFRDPRPLFEAVRRAAAAGFIDPSNIRFRFLGGGSFGESSTMRDAIAEAGLSSRVEFVPRIPYEESLVELSRASVLLLLQASRDTVDLVPAKLFEYLRVGRPVLALAPPGATAEVLRDTGGGWVVDPTDAGSLHNAIVTTYQAWLNGGLHTVSAQPAALSQFSRERLAALLAGVFDSLS